MMYQGGELRIYSKENAGTIIQMRIPRKELGGSI